MNLFAQKRTFFLIFFGMVTINTAHVPESPYPHVHYHDLLYRIDLTCDQLLDDIIFLSENPLLLEACMDQSEYFEKRVLTLKNLIEFISCQKDEIFFIQELNYILEKIITLENKFRMFFETLGDIDRKKTNCIQLMFQSVKEVLESLLFTALH